MVAVSMRAGKSYLKEIAAVAYDSRGYYLTIIPYDPQRLAGKKVPFIRLSPPVTPEKAAKRGGFVNVLS